MVVMWPVEVRAAVPARGQSRTVALMTSGGDRLAFSHLTPLPFPRVTLYDRGRDPLNCISRHTTPAARGSRIIVGQSTPWEG